MKAAGALIAGPARSDHANPAPLSPRRSGRTAMIAFENFCLQPSTHYVQQASKAKKPTKATATDKKKTKVRLHDARDVTVSFFDFHRRRRTFPPRRLRRGQRIGCHRATDEAPTAAVRSINGFRREQETHLGSSVREAECPLWEPGEPSRLGGDQTGYGIEHCWMIYWQVGRFTPCGIRRQIRRYASDFGGFAKAVSRRNKFSSTRFAPVNAGGQKWLILIISGSR